MAKRLSDKYKSKMQNPVIQFFKFIGLNIKIMKIVAGGHGGTRGADEKE